MRALAWPMRVQRVVREVALRAAGLLAQQAHRFELVQQVAGGLVDVQHAVHVRPLVPSAQHQRRELGHVGVVVGDADPQ